MLSDAVYVKFGLLKSPITLFFLYVNCQATLAWKKCKREIVHQISLEYICVVF